MNRHIASISVVLLLLPISGLTCPEDCLEGQPNPAVISIDFNLVSRDTDSTGTVEIVGTVENLGSGTFDSAAGQQAVQIWAGPSLTSLNMLASQPFEDLAPGAQVSVSYELEWNTSNEFPPIYRVILSYDPDIYIDGNDDNDDCATSDNALQRDGSEINDLFT
ncbi:MAG: hypothetical protein H6819_10160 [Phycisphaerales bacterium]|nr:hypothetical protein [Phycisphaerales bacterium]MCB9856578.1 hypothetical protein [Phycisphaerales bacterium]MCB9864625.1 hypothetical protein [Phycisphaerales bacterium]